jgi:hypothetical protein
MAGEVPAAATRRSERRENVRRGGRNVRLSDP